MLHGNIMHHFHHDNGFADTGTAEHAHLAPPRKGHQKINNLNAGLQNPHRGVLFGKFWRFTVDGKHFFLADRSQTVHGSADHIENPTQTGLTDRHHDLFCGVFNRHPPHQPVGDVHGDGANHIITQMLGNLYYQVIGFIADGGIADGQCRINRRQFALLKFNVNNRSQYLQNFTNVLSHRKPPSVFVVTRLWRKYYILLLSSRMLPGSMEYWNVGRLK